MSMRRNAVITTALVLLFGGLGPATAQEGHGRNDNDKENKEKREKHQKQRPDQPSQDRQVPEEAQRNPGRHGQQRAQEVHERNAQRRLDQQQQREQQVDDRNVRRQRENPGRELARVSRDEQQERIESYRRNFERYRRDLDQRTLLADQRSAQLQRERRIAGYGFQREYYDRLRQQQLRLQRERYDYLNDPYYRSDWSYRYSHGGRYYQTNEYGVRLLRQAVNYGYQEGLLAGQADRQDRWRFNYQDSYAYQDANYGYDGRYVDQGEYNYYFREGFRRGYEDGFNSRYQYGTYSNGRYSILGTILGAILNLQSLR
jgi:hypothetical protein